MEYLGGQGFLGMYSSPVSELSRTTVDHGELGWARVDYGGTGWVRVGQG